MKKQWEKANLRHKLIDLRFVSDWSEDLKSMTDYEDEFSAIQKDKERKHVISFNCSLKMFYL